jgi:integrase
MAKRVRQRRQKGTGSVRRKGRGWQLAVRVPGRTSPITEMRYQPPTPAEVVAWAVRQLEVHGQAPAAAGSLAADVEDYQRRVTAMPTYRQVVAHLDLWLDVLGRERSRRSITTGELDAIIQRWLVTPPQRPGSRGPAATGLSASTIRKRVNTLRMLFVTLDGKDARNPVRAVRLPRMPKPQPRGRDYATIARILAAMPEKRQSAHNAPALGRVRAAVMAYSGLPPKLIMALTPTDLDFDARTIRVPERHKGGGVEARVLPMMPQAVAAFRTFHQLRAYGPFAVCRLNTGFKRAAKRIGLDPRTITLYDLRHSFGEQVYRATRDLATVGRLLMHVPGSRVTARYAMGANDEINRAAAAAFGQTVAAVTACGETPQAPAISARRRKPRPVKQLRAG